MVGIALMINKYVPEALVKENRKAIYILNDSICMSKRLRVSLHGNKLALLSHHYFLSVYCHVGIFKANLQLVCSLGHQVSCVELVDGNLCYDERSVTRGLKLNVADVVGDVVT